MVDLVVVLLLGDRLEVELLFPVKEMLVDLGVQMENNKVVAAVLVKEEEMVTTHPIVVDLAEMVQQQDSQDQLLHLLFLIPDHLPLL